MASAFVSSDLSGRRSVVTLLRRTPDGEKSSAKTERPKSRKLLVQRHKQHLEEVVECNRMMLQTVQQMAKVCRFPCGTPWPSPHPVLQDGSPAAGVGHVLGCCLGLRGAQFGSAPPPSPTTDPLPPRTSDARSECSPSEPAGDTVGGIEPQIGVITALRHVSRLRNHSAPPLRSRAPPPPRPRYPCMGTGSCDALEGGGTPCPL